MTKAPASTVCLHASEVSKLSRQRPPPLTQSISDTPIIPDKQAPSHEPPITWDPDSSNRGTTKSRRSSLLGSPSIPQEQAEHPPLPKSRRSSLLGSLSISQEQAEHLPFPKSRRSSLLGSPSIPQTLSPFSLAQAHLLVPSKSLSAVSPSLQSTPSIPQTPFPPPQARPLATSKSSLLSAFASPAAPFPPSAPNMAFARSLSCSSYGPAAMLAGDTKQLQSQQSLKHAKPPLPFPEDATFIPQQGLCEDKLPSARQLPSLQSAAQRAKPSLEERMSIKSDSGIKPNYFLPPEVIRMSSTKGNGLMASDLPQFGRKSAPSQSSVASDWPQLSRKSAPSQSSLAARVSSSTHSGSWSPTSDDGSVPLHPIPPQEQPCAFRRKTILAPIHHMRQQPLHKESSPSQGRLSDSATEGVEVHQQQQRQQQQLGPHLEYTSRATSLTFTGLQKEAMCGATSLSDAPSLSSAQSLSLSPRASGVFVAGAASKRRSSGVQKQVTIAGEHVLNGAEVGTGVLKSARCRSAGEELIRPGNPLAGAQRQMEGERGGLMSRRSRWSCAGLLKTDDSPVSRELLAYEREKHLRLKGSLSCEQLAQANARANPTAFCMEAVEAEEAERELAAEAAQLCLQKLEGRPSNNKQAVDQFHTKVRLLRASRSFYHAPEAEKQQVTRASLVPGQSPWSLEHSLFQQRAKENEARDIFDTVEVLDAQFEVDWQRICQKGGLEQAVAAATVNPAAHNGEAINRQPEVNLQLGQVRHELRKHIHTVRSCFIFFAALAPTHRSHELMAMRMQDFREFTHCCNISDPRSPSCTPADVESIFKASKGPAGPNEVQHGMLLKGMATQPHLLHRSEFMECIVRLAIAKHFKATHAAEGQPSVAAAVARLFEEDIEPNLSPTAKVDANAFRQDRLYSEDMEVCIRSHWTLLETAFKVYSAGGDVLSIESWLALLAAGALLGRANHTGIDKHAAKVVFMLSQASVVDKLGAHQNRAEGLKFYDFVEALARLSEILCPPTSEELSSLFQSQPPTLQSLSAEASDHLWLTLMDETSSGSRSGEPGSASTTSIADTEVTSTMPPLLGQCSDPCAASKSGGAEASALPQLKEQPKPAAGMESPLPTLHNGSNTTNSSGSNTINSNGSDTINSSGSNTINSNGSNTTHSSGHASSRVHIFFRSLLQWQQLCKHRMREAGLDKALHAAARQRPLLDCFAPMMELFESGMRRTWGGQSQAGTVANMRASLGL